jgi:predicted O-methyltransferase YrrM
MTVQDIRDLAASVLVDDPRPDSMQEWQRQHPDPWIAARRYYRFLYEYARQYRPRVMVELGTDHGYGAWHMAAGNPDGLVIAVDLTHEHVEEITRLPNILAVTGDATKAVSAVRDAASGRTIDLLVVDDAHEPGHARREVDLYTPLCSFVAVQCFDDIEYPRSMRRFWADLDGEKLYLPELHPCWRDGSRRPGFGVRIV